MSASKGIERSGSDGILENEDQLMLEVDKPKPTQTLSPQRVCLIAFEGKRLSDGTVVGQNGLVIQTEGAGKMTPITNGEELLGTLDDKSPERIREAFVSLKSNRVKLLLEVVADNQVEDEKNKEPNTSDGTGAAVD